MAYLSDSAGRQVTPVVLREGPKDPLPPDANLGAVRAYNRAHGLSLPPGRPKLNVSSDNIRRQANSMFTPFNRQEDADDETDETDEENEEADEEDQSEDETEGEDMKE